MWITGFVLGVFRCVNLVVCVIMCCVVVLSVLWFSVCFIVVGLCIFLF